MTTPKQSGLEFLRFGSSIPGGYWGCCACDIIQNFKVAPNAKASIQLVSGDGGGDLGGKFMGSTYEEIFRERVRVGTFSSTDMPNHAFIAILTEWQLVNKPGKSWLPILKDEGFEFIRTVDNSVYSGHSVSKGESEGDSSHKNHIFMLVRNIGSGSVKDPFTPPAQWSDLKSKVPEAWELLSKYDRTRLAKAQSMAQREHWFNHGTTKFVTEAELVKNKVPVVMAGLRLDGAAPALKADRDAFLKKGQADQKAFPSPMKAA